MGPMDESRLVIAAVVGAEAPTLATAASAAVIVASTAYLSLRGRQCWIRLNRQWPVALLMPSPAKAPRAMTLLRPALARTG